MLLLGNFLRFNYNGLSNGFRRNNQNINAFLTEFGIGNVTLLNSTPVSKKFVFF